MLRAHPVKYRTRGNCKQKSPDKGTWYCTRKLEVVVGRAEVGVDVCNGESVSEDIVRGLDVEGLFDFGVWGNEEVKEDKAWYEQREGSIWERQMCLMALESHVPRGFMVSWA